MGNPAIWQMIMGQDADDLRDLYAGLVSSRFRASGRADRVADAEVISYTAVEDLEAAVFCAERLGSQVLVPITRLPDARIAVVSDSDGRPVGLRSALSL